MVYIIIIIILALLTVKGVLGKKTSLLVQDNAGAYLLNAFRMAMCACIGLALVFLEGAHGYLKVDPVMLAICLLSGIANVAFLVGWIFAIKKNAMVTVDVSLTLGSLIPAVLCAIFFAEAISIPKMIGFALILASTAILAKYNKKTLGGTGIGGAVLLFIAAVGDGIMGFAQQLFRHYYTEGGNRYCGISYPKSVFHFYTYVFAAAALAILLLCHYITSRNKARCCESLKQIACVRVLGIIFVMALCMFVSSYLQTVASNDFGMPSQVLYPIIKGGCLITVNVTAMLFFGEKITVRSITGSLVALIGIITMNVL